MHGNSCASELVELLREKQMTVACAESCTGGMVASAITDIAGASAVFGFGVVSYSNQAKMSLLGVTEETIGAYTEVSAQAASEMAKGIRRVASSDMGLSTTGYAGPGGGTPENPCGTIFCGISFQEKDIVFRLDLAGTRDENRAAAVGFLLDAAVKEIRRAGISK